MLISNDKEGAEILAQMSDAVAAHQRLFSLLKRVLEAREKKKVASLEKREDAVHEELMKFFEKATFVVPRPPPRPAYKKDIKKMTLTIDIDGVKSEHVVPYTELSLDTFDVAMRGMEHALSKIFFELETAQ